MAGPPARSPQRQPGCCNAASGGKRASRRVGHCHCHRLAMEHNVSPHVGGLGGAARMERRKVSGAYKPYALRLTPKGKVLLRDPDLQKIVPGQASSESNI